MRPDPHAAERRRPVARLARQANLVFISLALLGSIAIGLAYRTFSGHAQAAQIVDQAGRLRMLTQSIVLALHRVRDGDAGGDLHTRALLAEFDAGLADVLAAAQADGAPGPVAEGPWADMRRTGAARLAGEWAAFRPRAEAFLMRQLRHDPGHDMVALEASAGALLRAAEDYASGLIQWHAQRGRSIVLALYLALLLGLTLTAAAALWIWGRLLFPLRLIVDAAERLRRGDWSARVGYLAGDELGQLAAVIDSHAADVERMAGQLQAGEARLVDVERSLLHQRTHEPVTGLPNRVLLLDRLTQAIALASRRKRCVAVLHVDLDHFKYVNDSLGQAAGNQLLRLVAGRLGHCVREHDTVACLGADEFVVVLSDHGGEDEVRDVAQRILQVLADPARVAGHAVPAEGSIGIALYPRDGDEPAQLLIGAEMAMFQAKEEGRNTLHFHTTDLQRRFAGRLALESDLRRAIAQSQFVLHYQPQIDLASGRACGAEALIRWQHPDKGLLSPAHFIPLAEETGLIVPIGDWVSRQVCADLAAWRRAGLPRMAVSLNLSARQFRDAGLVTRLAQTVAAAGIDAGDLTIELTESVVMQNPGEALEVLQQLQAIGLRLSLDDFGTGYSSFDYLRRLPIDELKIDRSFVADIPACPDAVAIVSAMTGLAHALGKRVVVEGVEQPAQRRALRRFGCDLAQGYLFCVPMALAELMTRTGVLGEARARPRPRFCLA